MKKFNKNIGNYCEDIASDYLTSNNYKILSRNFRCRIGEIDIICIKDNILSVVEVKGRYSYNYGTPCQCVNKNKQKNIIQTTQIYLLRKHLSNVFIQFDVIEVFLNYKDNSYILNHIKNAFQLN